MSEITASNGRVQTTLLRPLHVSIALAAVILTLSMGFVSYAAWRSTHSLDPIENNLRQIQLLQQTDNDIAEVLSRHLNDTQSLTAEETSTISADLRQLTEMRGFLHPETKQNLEIAQESLTPPFDNTKLALIEALSVIRTVLEQENELQHSAIEDARSSYQAEFQILLLAMLLTPVVFGFLIYFVYRHSFQTMTRLSQLLNNVGNLDFQAIEPENRNDPLSEVYQHYNEMTARLRAASAQTERHTTDLQNQVRAASETLLRQQAELENGAKLAAIGEFSARLAHELRNPISGISVALHNMEYEIEDADHKERIVLIAEEMDRVTRLLNALLLQKPTDPETPEQTSLRSLVGDILRLFGYRLPQNVRIHSEIEDATLLLPRDTMRQVLLNLLKNACEAIGDNEGGINVTATLNDNNVELTITDNGPGYPQELLENGIQPFRSEKLNGAGLGLSVTSRMIQGIGGTIKLGHTPTGGAKTQVIIPAQGTAECKQ